MARGIELIPQYINCYIHQAMNKIPMLFIIILMTLISCKENQTYLFLKTEEINGITKNAPVALRGIEIGEVSGINLDFNNNLFIQIAINKDIRIPVDSKFTIENKDLFGEKQIEVILGESDVTFLSNDSSILHSSASILLPVSIMQNVLKTRDSLLIELQRLNENLEMMNELKENKYSLANYYEID